MIYNTVLEHLRLWALDKPIINLEWIKIHQWSIEFEELMHNRLIMGYFRYTSLGHPLKPKFDHINSIRSRLDLYEKTGNTEHLVDCANLCMAEFVEGDHPNKHFVSVDDGEHTNIKDIK